MHCQIKWARDIEKDQRRESILSRCSEGSAQSKKKYIARKKFKEVSKKNKIFIEWKIIIKFGCLSLCLFNHCSSLNNEDLSNLFGICI